VVDPGLVQLARGFTGAWPYLELLAGSAAVADPLDARVVEAYWIGSELLERVSMAELGGSLEERFRSRLGMGWSRLVEPLPAGARPHHNFHVFAVYPWVGLLRSGRSGEPLRVLDRCRIRWGRVLATIDGGRVLVRSRPLSWDGHRLGLGRPVLEEAIVAVGGTALTAAGPGDWVALHWDWVCHRISPAQLRALRRVTAGQLAAVNGTAHPAPAAVLG
jgi:hypothetical protein